MRHARVGLGRAEKERANLMLGLLKKVIGDPSQRQVKKNEKLVDQIEALASEMKKLSDDGLRAKTEEFKQRYQKGETFDDLLVEAFAVVREASTRVLHMIHILFSLWVRLLFMKGISRK